MKKFVFKSRTCFFFQRYVPSVQSLFTWGYIIFIKKLCETMKIRLCQQEKYIFYKIYIYRHLIVYCIQLIYIFLTPTQKKKIPDEDICILKIMTIKCLKHMWSFFFLYIYLGGLYIFWWRWNIELFSNINLFIIIYKVPNL